MSPHSSILSPQPKNWNVRAENSWRHARVAPGDLGLFSRFNIFNVCFLFSASPLRSETILLPGHPCPSHKTKIGFKSMWLPVHSCRHNSIRVSRAFGIRLPVHPCPNHNDIRVSRACGYQCTHAQTIITFVFREHAVTSASMPKP